MADRIEVSKVTELVTLGPPADNIAVSKVVMLLVLEPGTDDGGAQPDSSQAHVYAQIVGNS